VLKLILGIGNPLIGRLLIYDALDADFRTLTVRKHPLCPLCGETPTIRSLTAVTAACS
jgi:molybdopterin/thiamine biosynthesis adenylyltransferase